MIALLKLTSADLGNMDKEPVVAKVAIFVDANKILLAIKETLAFEEITEGVMP